MHWIIETFWTNRAFNDWVAMLFYWLPLTVNGLVYTFRVYRRIRDDRAEARGEKRTYPTEDYITVGSLCLYFAATVTPLVNFCYFIFSTMADLWSMIYHRFSWFFNIRLVPAKRGGGK